VRGNIWKYAVGSNSATDKFAFEHPAIFPEALAADHVRTWSNEGETVLDPFSGSGTTAKVASALGRHYIGFEISSEYCNIIEKRLNATQTLFG
jgi:site-specific DNA-methyltransferase (adenine-specific)